MFDLVAEGRRLAEAERQRWNRRRAAEVAAVRRQIAAGRRAWEAAGRIGADVAGRTAGELRELGAAALGATLPRGAVDRYLPPRSRTPPTRQTGSRPGAPARPAADRLTSVDWRNVRREVDRQVAAAVRGATDEVTFGVADRASAAVRAVPPTFQGADWGDQYSANMAEERAQDRYDAENYGAARTTGQVGGAVGSFFIPGGVIIRGGKAVVGAAKLANLALRERSAMAALQAARRGMAPAARSASRRVPGLLKGAARTSGAERLAWVLGPGAVNAGVQMLDDGLTRGAVSPRDAAGAFVGGMIAGRARGLGPAASAAIGAAATSAIQDGSEGRMPSLERMSHAAYAAREFGALGGLAGQRISSSLSIRNKGLLGEGMGWLRSAVNGRFRSLAPKISEQIGETGRRWVADGRSALLRFEDKFGDWARLSRNQKLAREALGDNFILYHFTPEDVARIAAVPSGILGRQVTQRPPDQP